MGFIFDLVVIGAGSGGMTAANYASRAGLSVTLVEKGLYGGQLNNTDIVENYTGFTSISGMSLSQEMEKQIRNQEGINHMYGDISEVSKENNIFKIDTKSGKSVSSKTIVIATGVKHKKLGVVGEKEYDGRSVSYCSVCDGNFFKGKSVSVVGGGNSAVESALYLSNIVKDVTLVHRRDNLRAEQLLQDRMNAKDNIKVVWNAKTNSIIGNGKHVTHIKYMDKETSDVKEIPVDGVFVYIGVEPVTEPFQDLPILDESGYIVTNDKMETSIEGIFAVGDVRQDSIRQVATAVGDGAIASKSVTEYLRGLE